uniref:Class I SAM-dependent methyltransferase n=1 Tax=Candidatus Methanomethylicus mesodigestus TaxID=1867258 RepID=A0A7C3IT53_9CREN
MAAGERRGINAAWDEVAEDFSAKRRRPWPSLSDLGSCKGERVLDLGAGAGRNTAEFVKQGAENVVAADISAKMLGIIMRTASARTGVVDVVRCDAVHLPFRSDTFSAVALIALIHHIPKKSDRLTAMKEVYRVAAPGSRILVTAWARGQLRFAKKIPAMLKSRLKGGEFGDACIEWGKKAKRFYHLFTKKELEETVMDAGFRIERSHGERIRSRLFNENWVVLGYKTPDLGGV